MLSILENLSWQYQKPDGFIYDNTKDKILEFWPAGYSQKFIRQCTNIKGAAEQVNRQEFYELLWKQAEKIEKTEMLFPFSEFKYELSLKPEPENRYDKNALRIILSAAEKEIEEWATYNIGYVPAKINKILANHMRSISDIQFMSVTNCLNDKFYCARIAIAYGKQSLIAIPNTFPVRFLDLF